MSLILLQLPGRWYSEHYYVAIPLGRPAFNATNIVQLVEGGREHYNASLP